MPAQQDVTATADRILDRARVFAVVGASPSSWRPSHGVMRTLLDHGYEVIPIRPGVDEVLGLRAYPDLASVPEEVAIDVVDIFRRSDRAGGHVDEAIERGVPAVWLQLGVIDHEAADRARAAGLDVVMDRCPAIELRRRRGRARS
jgi:uncharacterized protein